MLRASVGVGAVQKFVESADSPFQSPHGDIDVVEGRGHHNKRRDVWIFDTQRAAIPGELSRIDAAVQGALVELDPRLKSSHALENQRPPQCSRGPTTAIRLLGRQARARLREYIRAFFREHNEAFRNRVSRIDREYRALNADWGFR